MIFLGSLAVVCGTLLLIALIAFLAKDTSLVQGVGAVAPMLIGIDVAVFGYSLSIGVSIIGAFITAYGFAKLLQYLNSPYTNEAPH